MAGQRRIIDKEDIERMKALALKLAHTENKTHRFRLQMDFVHAMEKKYGHEKATAMLSKVWQMTKAKEEEEKDESEIY